MSPAIDEIRSRVAQIAGRGQQGTFQQGRRGRVIVVQLAVALGQLCQNAGNARGCSRGASTQVNGIVWIGAQLVLTVCGYVRLDPSVKDRSAAARTDQGIITEQIGGGDRVLPSLVPSGNVPPERAGAIATVGCSGIPGRKDMHELRILVDLEIHIHRSVGVPVIATIAVGRVRDHHAFIVDDVHGLSEKIGAVVLREQAGTGRHSLHEWQEIPRPGHDSGHHVAMRSVSGRSIAIGLVQPAMKIDMRADLAIIPDQDANT